MLKNLKIKFAATAMVLTGVGLAAWGVPARPGLNEIHLSDGSVVKASIIGDENSHYYLSPEGLPLIADNGLLFLAKLDNNGKAVSSGIKAAAIGSRDKAVDSLLAVTDKEAILAAIQTEYKAVARHKAPKGPGLFPGNRFPTSGRQKAVVILVEYQDVQFTQENPLEYFSDMLNQEGFDVRGGTGSARDFFIECSGGAFEPQFDVYGPVLLPHEMAYYGAHFLSQDRFPHKMAIEACDILDETVDFSEYDRDGDGEIDNVFIFYAGRGEATGGGPDSVWPHSAFVTAYETREYIYDGVKLNQYGCTNEIVDDHTDGVGTFIHEFSHILGLPDLYSTSYSSSFTPGCWSTLDLGPYNNEGRTPPRYSAFERYALGWLEPETIDDAADIVLNPISANEAYIVNATPDGHEYFLFENRQQDGWDTYIPGHGMLVWHVDYDDSVWGRNVVNNDSEHLYCDLIEADDKATDGSRAGDAFPGTANVKDFTFDTTPSFRPWSGEDLGLPITNISEHDGVIRFRVREGSFVMPVPEALPADDITSIGFTARWNKVDEAADYIVNVYKSSDDTPVISEAEAGDVSGYSISGLEFETEYYYTVTAVSLYGIRSDESPRIPVTTLPPTFEYLRPSVLQPQMNDDGSWEARWEPMDEADNYELNVFAREAGEPFADANNFDNALSSLPEGWNANGCSALANDSYAGDAIPSAKLNKGESHIQTPVYNDDISLISFWHRGISAPEDAQIVVSAPRDNVWTEVGKSGITNSEGGKTLTFENLPEGCRTLRITYVSPKSGAVAIDDVKVLHGHESIITSIKDYSPCLTGNVTSKTVTGTVPGTEYFYTVTALSGTIRSLPSEEMSVSSAMSADNAGLQPEWSLNGDTLYLSGIGNNTYTVADITGRILARGTFADGRTAAVSLPAHGIYILRISHNTIKIIH